MPLPELEARLRAAGGGENFKDWGNRNRMRRALEIALAGDVKDRYVPQYETLVLGVFVPRPLLHERIAARLDARFDAGMLDEIKYLHDGKGVSWERLESFGLEYRRCAEHLQGKVDFQTMRDTLLTDIRHFAKRQDIWFRKLEKKGIDIYWLEGDRFAEACSLMDTFLAGTELPPPGRDPGQDPGKAKSPNPHEVSQGIVAIVAIVARVIVAGIVDSRSRVGIHDRVAQITLADIVSVIVAVLFLIGSQHIFGLVLVAEMVLHHENRHYGVNFTRICVVFHSCFQYFVRLFNQVQCLGR
jgi:hypothetical protein